MSAIQYPDPPAQLKKIRFGTLLKYFGPGAVVASITVGSGETLFASRGGAIFGYTLMWGFALGSILKFAQVYAGARYMTLTGEHPMERWATLPGPKRWFPILIGTCAILTFPAWIGGLTGLLGNLCAWMTGVGDNIIWGVPFLFFIALISLYESYGVLELVEKIILGILLSSVMVAAIASSPDLTALLKGLLIPIPPSDYQPWVYLKYPTVTDRPIWVEVITYLGAVGGGTQDYLGYLGTLREKPWGALAMEKIRAMQNQVWPGSYRDLPRPMLPETPDQVALGRLWLRAPLIDMIISFSCVGVFTIAFAVCGATMLAPQQIIPDGIDLLNHQAQFLEHLHTSLLYVYQLGVFFVFFGTLYGAFEIYTRTVHETFRVIFPQVHNLRKVRLWTILYSGGGGLILLLTGWNPIALITPAAILGGVLSCGFWALGMVWIDRKFLSPQYRMGPGMLVMTTIAGISLTLFGFIALGQWILGFF